MSPNESGPEVTTPGPATSKISTATKQLDHQHDSRSAALPVVFGTLLLAMPGAVFDRVIIKSCCFCGYAHIAHVPVGIGRATSIVRPPRCAPWRRYEIAVVDVVPAVAVPGQRQRWSA